MLNPALDLGAAARQFAAAGRVLIPDFLHPDAAAELHACLERDVPWGLAYIQDGRPMLLQAAALDGLGAGDLARIRAGAEAEAQRGFSFLYGTYMMVTAYRERRDPGLLLHRMVEFLNTPSFLGLVARVADRDNLVKTGAQATRYLPGHFLTFHNDEQDAAREVAYVINLTRDWREEWGGTLHFADAPDQVNERYLPRFNSLALFKVPTGHFVSAVSETAPHPRYAITGWCLNR